MIGLNRKGWGREDATDDGITLKVAEMSENVLDAEAAGVNGEDQGTLLVHLGDGEQERNFKDTGQCFIHNSGGETMFTEERGAQKKLILGADEMEITKL